MRSNRSWQSHSKSPALWGSVVAQHCLCEQPWSLHASRSCVLELVSVQLRSGNNSWGLVGSWAGQCGAGEAAEVPVVEGQTGFPWSLLGSGFTGHRQS